MLVLVSLGLGLWSLGSQPRTMVSGAVTVRGKDTRSLRLVLRTYRNSQTTLSETIASDGSYHLEGDANPLDQLAITVPPSEVGYVGGPWLTSPAFDSKLNIDAIRLTGKSIEITPGECVRIILGSASTCAVQLDPQSPIPAGVVLNDRIALDRVKSATLDDIMKQVREAAPKSDIPGTSQWVQKIERDIRRAAKPLPEYRELDPEAVLIRLADLSGEPAMCKAMLALSFDSDEFVPNWKPQLLSSKFAEAIGVEGIHPGHVQFQIADLTEPDAPLSPPLIFARDQGVSADDLQQWAQQSPTARLYLFRLAVANLAKDETVRKRARALLARYRPRLRINL